jgi:hypothetical protein
MKCVVAFNPGLGDHIVMSGAVRHLLNTYDSIDLVSLWHDKEIYRLYRDEPRITVCPTNIKMKAKHKMSYYEKYIKRVIVNAQKSGFDTRVFFYRHHEKWPEKIKEFGLPYNSNWCQLFYKAIDVDWRERYDSFKLVRDFDKEQQLIKKLNLPQRYIFAVDCCSAFPKTSLSIGSEIPVVFPRSYPGRIKETSIFDWMGVIENAREVHTIDTSWLHLIMSMRLDKPKFFHDKRKFCATDYFNRDCDTGWQVINY